MNERSARAVLGVGLPLLVAAIGYLPLVLFGPELPDRLATHFDFSGTPDESMTVAGLVTVVSTMVTAGVVPLVALAAIRRPLQPSVGPLVAFSGAFLAHLGAGLLAWTVVTQRGLGDWRQADGPGWWLIPVIAGTMLVGGLGARAGAALPVRPSGVPGEADTPVMDLGPGEHALWSRSMHVPWMTWSALAIVVVGLVVASGTRWWLTLPSAVIGLSLLQVSVVRVQADRTGLAVHFGFVPGITVRIPVGRIERVAVIDVQPGQWGGWGYRGSLRLMRRAAVVLRAGPGLRLDLRDGKVFAVTIDDPEGAAALLNAEVQRWSTA